MVVLSFFSHREYLMQMFHDMEILQFLAAMTVNVCAHSPVCLCLFV